MTEYLILAAAAFFAGMLNTVAGGGTFLTFPALVYVGVPPVAANATSAVAVFPGYLGGAIGFRKEITSFDRIRLLKIVACTAIGGLTGSLLLLISSNAAFSPPLYRFSLQWLRSLSPSARASRHGPATTVSGRRKDRSARS